MAKVYWVTFGSGVPSSNAGLAPTFIQFWQSTGVSLAPPSIAEIGSSSGLYKFTYTPTVSIGFVIDGATTGLANNVRYVVGNLDNIDRMDEYGTTLVAIGTSLFAFGTTGVAIGTTLVGIGTTSVAIGTTLIGYGVSTLAFGVSTLAFGSTLTGYGASIYAGLTSTYTGIGTAGSTFGGASTNPVDVFGYLKRVQEFLEGNQDFAKATGLWDVYSRGSSTLLFSKTLSNDSVGVTKI